MLTTQAKEKSRGNEARPDQGLDHSVAQGDRHPGPRPEDRILRGGLTMPLRSYKATSPGLRQMTRSTFEEITTDEPYKPLLEKQIRGSGPEQRRPADGPSPRWRREAALSPDRLQARQAAACPPVSRRSSTTRTGPLASSFDNLGMNKRTFVQPHSQRRGLAGAPTSMLRCASRYFPSPMALGYYPRHE